MGGVRNESDSGSTDIGLVRRIQKNRERKRKIQYSSCLIYWTENPSEPPTSQICLNRERLICPSCDRNNAVRCHISPRSTLEGSRSATWRWKALKRYGVCPVSSSLHMKKLLIGCPLSNPAFNNKRGIFEPQSSRHVLG